MKKFDLIVPNISSVHDALQKAIEMETNRVALKNANFKIHPVKKEIADSICVANGTTLSAFLRACVDSLVRDFAGPKAAEFMEAMDWQEGLKGEDQ